MAERRPRTASQDPAINKDSSKAQPSINGHARDLPVRQRRVEKPYESGSHGLWKDVYTMRWMRVPLSSLKMLSIPIILWANWELLAPLVHASHYTNPFARLLFIQNRIPGSPDAAPRYQKSYDDLFFVAYWVVCFSFIRLFATIYVFYPMARAMGIRSEGKVFRFGEQGYSIVYYSAMTVFGLYVMYGLPTWYFQAEVVWTSYPLWSMTPELKTYYLLHGAYWTQQLLVLALRLEKPRKDYMELILHHIVTVWLIGWSYLVSMTWMGNMVFITMDVSDVFLSVAKIFNYLHWETTGNIVFAVFVGVWTYTRHYLNIYLLRSVWHDFKTLPAWTQKWSPEEGVWMAPWVQYQIFGPLLILQIVNIFWYYAIWRILLKAVFSSGLADDRSDDEGDDPAVDAGCEKEE